MKRMNTLKSAVLAASLVSMGAGSAGAATDIRVTEVAPWSSGNSPVSADWFELTNIGASSIDISGWKVDDNSNSFAVAVALNGITTIGAGESVILLESSAANPPATVIATFKSTWFGASVPAGLQFGTYQGSGIGLGTSGDAVNIFDGSGALKAKVTFGASPTGPSFPTFFNPDREDAIALVALSQQGTYGAFTAFNSVNEIGSPGIAPVPEPETYALMLLGVGLVSWRIRAGRRLA